MDKPATTGPNDTRRVVWALDVFFFLHFFLPIEPKQDGSESNSDISEDLDGLKGNGDVSEPECNE